MKPFMIYYRKEPSFTFDKSLTRTEVMNEVTHAYLTMIRVDSLNDIFYNMQGEIWSPRGEMRPLIELRRLEHTSMSVGDVAFDVTENVWYQVDSLGWKEID